MTLDAAHPDLERQANVIADWAENLPLKRVYIFGSRVRGDAAPDSDIDVAIELSFRPTVKQCGTGYIRTILVLRS